MRIWRRWVQTSEVPWPDNLFSTGVVLKFWSNILAELRIFSDILRNIMELLRHFLACFCGCTTTLCLSSGLDPRFALRERMRRNHNWLLLVCKTVSIMHMYTFCRVEFQGNWTPLEITDLSEFIHAERRNLETTKNKAVTSDFLFHDFAQISETKKMIKMMTSPPHALFVCSGSTWSSIKICYGLRGAYCFSNPNICCHCGRKQYSQCTTKCHF